MVQRARSRHEPLSRQACKRRRRRYQGLPRVTGAVATSTSGDRGGAETIPFIGIQKCPRTDLLLRLTVLRSAGAHRKADPAATALASTALPWMPGKTPCSARSRKHWRGPWAFSSRRSGSSRRPVDSPSSSARSRAGGSLSGSASAPGSHLRPPQSAAWPALDASAISRQHRLAVRLRRAGRGGRRAALGPASRLSERSWRRRSEIEPDKAVGMDEENKRLLDACQIQQPVESNSSVPGTSEIPN